MMTRLLIVTPMHNEERNVAGLHDSLAAQTFRQFDWVVVDDGCTDGTRLALNEAIGFPAPDVVQSVNAGGLIGGSAYRAWRVGIHYGLGEGEESKFTHVMKLDADVRLSPTWLEQVLAEMGPTDGLGGGIIGQRRHREQQWHVPGPAKLYTLPAYRALESLPSAIGFDVMDEVALRELGFTIQVVRSAVFEMSRAIGASEGGLHGRFRNGRVCRWTGYNTAYFALHCARYVFRQPIILGSAWMVGGYLSAGPGPYSPALRKAHGQWQVLKLRQLVRSPYRWLKQTYGM